MSRWRFAEFQYLQAGPPRRLQTVVVYLPDVWTVMPTLEEWEALCQQKAAEAAPAPPEAPAVSRGLRTLGGGHLNPGTQVVTGLDLCHRKQSLQSSRLMGRSKQQTPLSRVPRIRRSLRSRKRTPTSQRPPHPLWNQLSWHAPAV